MLPQDKKLALKARVQEMIDAGADDETIQAAIDIVTKKYDVPATEAKPSIPGLGEVIPIPKDNGNVQVKKVDPLAFPQQKSDRLSKPMVSNSPDDGSISPVTALFPRMVDKMMDGHTSSNPLPVFNAIKSDVLSLPGRTLASVPDAVMRNSTLEQGMVDTKGKTTVGKMVRSPATGAAIAVAPFTGGTSLAAIGGSIAASSLAGAAEQQAENLNDGKEVSGKEFATDLGLGIAGGGLAYGAGKYVVAPVAGAIAKKIGKVAFNKAVNQVITDVKPSGKMIEQGFNKPTLAKHELIGSPSEVLSKSKTLMDRASDEISTEIKNLVKRGGKEPTVDITDLIAKMADRKKLTPEFINEEEAALTDLLNRIANRDGAGLIKISEIAKIKKAITNLRNDFANPPSSPADAILGKAYHEIDEAFYTAVDGMAGDVSKIREANKALSELIPISDILEKKIAQGVEEKIPGLASKMVGGASKLNNIGSEVALHAVGVPPGALTAIRTMGTIGDHYSPSMAQRYLNSKQATALIEMMNNPNIPTPVRTPILNKIFSGKDLTFAEIKELEQVMDAAIQSKKSGTLGQIGNLQGTIQTQSKAREQR